MGALTVLVVDDQEDIARMVSRALSKHFGSDAQYALSVDDALLAIRDRVPDVVVSDLNMGPRHGDELLRAIRASHPSILRILHTSTEPEILESLLELQVAHDIVKKDGTAKGLILAIERFSQAADGVRRASAGHR